MKAAVGIRIEHEQAQGQSPLVTRESDAGRLADIAGSYFEFAWRSLRRLGVPEPSVDDAVQQLFLVVARRLRNIEPDREQSFIFGTAVRIAATFRRKQQRDWNTCTIEIDGVSNAIAPLPSPEEFLELKTGSGATRLHPRSDAA